MRRRIVSGLVGSLVTGALLVTSVVPAGADMSLPSPETSTIASQLVFETASTFATSTTIAVDGDVACGATETDYNGGAGTATACRMGVTAQLIKSTAPARVFALGDLQYNTGSPTDFKVSYQNSWGQSKARC